MDKGSQSRRGVGPASCPSLVGFVYKKNRVACLRSGRGVSQSLTYGTWTACLQYMLYYGGGWSPTTFACSCTRRTSPWAVQPRTLPGPPSHWTKPMDGQRRLSFIHRSFNHLHTVPSKIHFAPANRHALSVLSCSQPTNKRCFALRPLAVVQTQREHPHVGRQSDR